MRSSPFSASVQPWPLDDLHRSIAIDENGLVFGAGTCLARMGDDGGLALDTDRERVLVLLSVVCRTPVAGSLLHHIEAASARWQHGDRALANLRLVFAGLPQLDDPGDADRLGLAAYLLDHGMSPETLMKELGLDPTPLGFRKYDPDQPRNPAGSGRASGQWTKGPTSQTSTSQASATQASATQASASYAPALLAARAPSLADALGPEALTWLARVAGRLALPVALFGAAFIPSPNGAITEEGPLPGRTDLSYRLDHDTGILRLSSNDDSDPTHALVAQLGADGVYHDIDTGVAIARAVGAGTVLIDLDRAGVVSQAPATDDDQPKLCPAPSEDRPGGRKLFDEMYEQYVRNTVNPQRDPQLPPGLTFALPGDTASGWVKFDDCRESDGTMIEAKGNYADLVATEFGRKRLSEDWLDQAGKQVRASQGRRVEWYFHDASAAAFAKKIFADASYDRTISVHVLPYPGGVPKPNPRIR